ncbi:MAG: MerR family transcriptional regulator [Chloroflexota bacterium]|nr:MerR family transcriptional regulator [Chloroflexota bacterium]
MRELLQIGEVATLLGISTKTIRYYQQIGLLATPRRSQSGYRLYSAIDLLRLLRIKRLRALGLSLDRIKAALTISAGEKTGDEDALRSILQALEEDLSAQIQALEKQRAAIRKLLTQEKLSTLEQPADPEASLYLDVVLPYLEPLLSQVNPALLELEKRLDALLGSFNWPEAYKAGYREMMQSGARFYAEHPDHYTLMIELNERFALLARVPEDSSEVERFVEYYLQSDALHILTSSMLQASELASAHLSHTDHPFAQVMGELMLSTFSPAQRRAFAELSRKSTMPSSQDEI